MNHCPRFTSRISSVSGSTVSVRSPPVAIAATAVGATVAMLVVLLGSSDAAAFSWFIGAGLAFAVHMAASRRAPQAAGRS